MDTISRENNSMLPVGSIVVGVVALLLGGIAIFQASQAKKLINEQLPKIEKIDAVEAQANNAMQAASNTSRDLKTLHESMQGGFNTVGGLITNLQTSVTKLEEAAKKPVVASKKGGPVVAGPDEYIIKKGDYGAKIAKAQGVSLADLQAVNPGADLSKVQIGQKIKLPAKK